jgi:hypothetical protein
MNDYLCKSALSLQICIKISYINPYAQKPHSGQFSRTDFKQFQGIAPHRNEAGWQNHLGLKMFQSGS